MVHHFAKMYNGSTVPGTIEKSNEDKVEKFLSTAPSKIAAAPAAVLRSSKNIAYQIWQGKDNKHS